MSFTPDGTKRAAAVRRVQPPAFLGRLRLWLFGYDVFISHTRSGLNYSEALFRTLSEAGLTCFLDTDEMPAGSALRREIATALSRSGMLVLVVSETPFKPLWPLAEIHFFRQLRSTDPLLPICVVDQEAVDRSADFSWAAINKVLFEIDPGLDLRDYWRPGITDRLRFMLNRIGAVFSRKSVAVSPEREYLGLMDSVLPGSERMPGAATLAGIEKARTRARASTLSRFFFRFIGIAILLLVSIIGFLMEKSRGEYPDKAIAAVVPVLERAGFQVTVAASREVEVLRREAVLSGIEPSHLAEIADALSTVDRYGKLLELDLTSSSLEDLKPLKCLRTVRVLKLQECPLKTLGEISCWESIEVLDLNFQTSIEEAEFIKLARLGNLRELYLHRCSEVTDEVLSRLPPLEYLDATGCPKVTDEGVRRLDARRLKQLKLNSSGVQITANLLHSIEQMESLQILDLSRGVANDDQVARLRQSSDRKKLKLHLKN